jgi:hypothetical protein
VLGEFQQKVHRYGKKQWKEPEAEYEVPHARGGQGHNGQQQGAEDPVFSHDFTSTPFGYLAEVVRPASRAAACDILEGFGQAHVIESPPNQHAPGEGLPCIEAEEFGILRRAQVSVVLQVLYPVVAVDHQQGKAKWNADGPVQFRIAERRMVQALVLEFHHVGVRGAE